MKRLKNSVKILIISLSVLVVAVGTILAVVLTRKPTQNTTVQPQQVLGFSDEQKKFAEDIVNSKTAYHPVLMQGSPYEGICDFSLVREFDSKYFTCYTSDTDYSKNLYIYQEKQTKDGYNIKNLTATETDGGFVEDDFVSFDVVDVKGEYAIIETQYAEDENYTNSVFKVVCFADFENPVVVYEFDARLSNQIFILSDEILLTNNLFAIAYCEDLVFDGDDFEAKMEVEAFALQKTPIDKASSKFIALEGFDYSTESDDSAMLLTYSDCFVVEDKTKFDVYYFANNSWRTDKHTKTQNANGQPVMAYRLVKISDNKYFFETASYTYSQTASNAQSIYRSTDAFGNKVYVNNFYQIWDLSSANITKTDYQLFEGCAVATVQTNDLDGYYYIVQQKVQNNQDIQSFVSAYYLENNNQLVVSYESSSSSEPVIYAGEDIFVTKNRVMRYQNSKITNLVTFSSSEFPYSIQQKGKILGDILVVTTGQFAGLIDIYGNVLFDPNESDYYSIMPISETEFIAKVSNTYNKINKYGEVLGVYEALENDENLNNDSLFMKQVNMLISEDQNGLFSFTQYTDGKVVASNVKEYKFLQLSSGFALRIVDNTTLKVSHINLVNEFGETSTEYYSFSNGVDEEPGDDPVLASNTNTLAELSDELQTESYAETSTFYSKNYVEVREDDYKLYYSYKFGDITARKSNNDKAVSFNIYYCGAFWSYGNNIYYGHDDNTGDDIQVATVSLTASSKNPTLTITTSTGWTIVDLQLYLSFSNRYTYKIDRISDPPKGYGYNTRMGSTAYYSTTYSGKVLGDKLNLSYNQVALTQTYSVQFDYNSKDTELRIGSDDIKNYIDCLIVPTTYDFHFYQADPYSTKEVYDGTTNHMGSMTLYQKISFNNYEIHDGSNVIPSEIVFDVPIVTCGRKGGTFDTWINEGGNYDTPLDYGDSATSSKSYRDGQIGTIFRELINESKQFIGSEIYGGNEYTDYCYGYLYGRSTFYAYYRPNTYKVEFRDSNYDVNGNLMFEDDGELQFSNHLRSYEYDSSTQEWGEVLVQPLLDIEFNNWFYIDDEPRKQGHNFIGWYICGMSTYDSNISDYKSCGNQDHDTYYIRNSDSEFHCHYPILWSDESTRGISNATSYTAFQNLEYEQDGTVIFVAMWEPREINVEFILSQSDYSQSSPHIGIVYDGNDYVETEIADKRVSLEVQVYEDGVLDDNFFTSRLVNEDNSLKITRLIHDDYELYSKYFTFNFSKDIKIKDLLTYDLTTSNDDYESNWLWNPILKKTNVNVLNTTNYVFDGWLLYDSQENAYIDVTNEKLPDILKNIEVLTFYAKYAKKPYDIYTTIYSDYAHGVSEKNESQLVFKEEIKYNDDQTSWLITDDENLECGVISDSEKIQTLKNYGYGAYRNVTGNDSIITFKIEYEDNFLPYKVRAIALRNFAIKGTDGGYYLTDVTFFYNENRTSSQAIFKIRLSNDEDLVVSTVKIGTGTYYVIDSSEVSGTFKSLQALRDAYDQFISVEFNDPESTGEDESALSYHEIIITVYDCRNTSKYTSSSNVIFNKETHEGFDTFGFIVRVEITSNITKLDTVNWLGNSNALNMAAMPIVKETSGGQTKYYYYRNNLSSSVYGGNKLQIKKNETGNGNGVYVYDDGVFKFDESFNMNTKLWENLVTPDATLPNEFIYVDFEENVIYYFETKTGFSAQENSYAKINNNNVIVFVPEQHKVALGRNTNSFLTSDRYELRSYLSSLQIEDKTINFNITKNLAFDGLVATGHEEYLITENVSFVKSNEISEEIYYMGRTFNAFVRFDISIEYQAYTRDYVLYCAIDDTDNYFAYFLYTYVPYDSHAVGITRLGINAYFSDLEYSQTVSVDKLSTDNYGDENIDNAATVELNEFVEIGSNFVSTTIADEDTSNDFKYLYSSEPMNARLFKISPTDGYTIDQVEIIIKQMSFSGITGKTQSNKEEVAGSKATNYNLLLNNMNLVKQGGYYSYDYIGGNASNQYLIGLTYSADRFKTFENYSTQQVGTGLTYYSGVYLDFTTGRSWYLNGSDLMFESFYIFVSGLYADIDINVSVSSSVEFLFDIDTEQLGHSMLGLENYPITPTGDDLVASSLNAADGNNLYYLEDLTHLSILVKDEFGESRLLNDDDATYVVYNSSLKYVRIIFRGKADLFEYGFTIFATGNDYSNYLTNSRYYAMNADNNFISRAYPFDALLSREGRTYNDRKLDTSFTNDQDKLTLIDVGNAAEFFGIAPCPSSMAVNYGEITGQKYINYRKFIMALDVHYNYVESTMHSYVYNDVVTKGVDKPTDNSYYTQAYNLVDGNKSHRYWHDTSKDRSWLIVESTTYGYQLDDTKKMSSWFNDTMLTNIDYSFFRTTLIDTKYAGTTINPSNWNWQETDGSTPTALTSKTVNGYEIVYTYYDIPGYYLQYINITTVDFGVITISPNVSVLKNVSGQDVITKRGCFNIGGYQNYYYDISYTKSEGKFVLRLYNNSNDANRLCSMNSIGIMSNDFDVSFYSMAIPIVITYEHSDKLEDNVSSYSQAKWYSSGNLVQDAFTKTKTQTLYYDSFTMLSYSMEMPGYTFLGWGSSNYYTPNGDSVVEKSRYYYSSADGQNMWSTSSAWVSPVNMPLNDGTFVNIFDYRYYEFVDLVQDRMYSRILTHDFYVKSSDSTRVNQTGYFITDTGNSTTENYNFWLQYISTFSANKGAALNTLRSYRISLVGVWKANTYALEFSANDSRSSNGTTTATYNKVQSAPSSSDEYYFDFGVSINSLAKLNDTAVNKKTYYVYITFDTKNWYIVDGSEVENNKGSPNFSYKADGTTSLVFSAENKLDIIVDRYGYSWLGWFNKKYAEGSYSNVNLKQGETSLPSSFVNSSLMFGSNYYLGVQTRTIPKLDYTNYLEFSDKIEIYSEFVYAGEQAVEYPIFNDGTNANDFYVCHYAYNIENSYVIVNNIKYYNYVDYSNVVNTNENKVVNHIRAAQVDAISSYFDTSLPYENYSLTQVDDGGSVTYNLNVIREQRNNQQDLIKKGRKLVLFAIWEMNKYTYVVDVRDYDSLAESTNRVGSTSVTNMPYSGNDIDFGYAYFDDNIESANIDFEDELNYRLSNFVPTRIGYDFLGWTYYFGYNYLSASDYADYKYQRFVNNYTLNNELISAYTTSVANRAVSNVLYYNGELVSQMPNNSFEASEIYFLDNQEIFGDVEGGVHHVYIFALWKPQMFTFNISMNISQENLINDYEKDSRYALGFYKSLEQIDGENTITIPYADYDGIKSSYLYEMNSYAEIPANLVFEIEFDDSFENSYLRIHVQHGSEDTITKKYYIKDLFAVSSGYYFLGWLYESGDPTKIFIANSLLTTFGKDGKMQNLDVGGESYFDTNLDGDSDESSMVFNYTVYNKMKNTNYAQSFEGVIDPLDTESLNVLDDAGESSNFGFVNISGQNYYLITESPDKNYRLYFRYFGVKYYVRLFYEYNDGNGIRYIELKNDDSFLYMEESGKKYIIRFDESGYSYYVNQDYDTKSRVDIRMAVFTTIDGASINSSENLFTKTAMLNKYTFIYKTGSSVNAEFSYGTTRQFSLFAHWTIKENLTASLINGNNAQTGADFSSNSGLAGYFKFNIDSGDLTSTNQYDELLTQTFSFYDDLNFEIIPYFNGRYISEIKFDFWRLEESSVASDNIILSSYVNYKYTITFKFAWNDRTKLIDIETITIAKYNNTTLDNYNEVFEVDYDSDLNLGSTAPALKSILTMIDKGELTESNIQNQNIVYNLLSAYVYAENGINYFDRIDVNKLSFDFKDVMTNIDVTCKFSVQTYNVDFYGILDENGNTLKPIYGETNLYTIGFTPSEFVNNSNSFNSAYKVNNAYEDSFPYLSSSLAIKETNIATISKDCASRLETYNVPYGYFIYGVEFNSNIPPNRSIDFAINENKLLDTNDYFGFEYIYAKGYYWYGTNSNYPLNKNGTDDYYSQASPILGPSSLSSQAVVRLNLSFYTFRGWFEEEGVDDATGLVKLSEYNRLREATYINRNITLYGYYYSINKPTSITFYTWDDNAASYAEYPGNAEDYTLTSNSTTAGFGNVGGKVSPNTGVDISQLVDANGIAMIRYNRQYGVDGSGFNKTYSLSEIPKDSDFLRNILRTYWYYQETYEALYFNDNGTIRYLKFAEDEGYSGFYYIDDNSSWIKVNVYSSNMSDFVMKPASSDWLTDIDENEITIYLTQETIYDFRGSSLYLKATFTASDGDRYYPLHNNSKEELISLYYPEGDPGLAMDADIIPDGMQRDLGNGSWDVIYRYYVDVMGSRYYISNMYAGTNAVNIYDGNGNIIASDAIPSIETIVTLDNYYILSNGVYTKINYTECFDSEGDLYINPYNYKSTVEFNGTTYYFNYSNEFLYGGYDEALSEYFNRAELNCRVYKAINDNYEVQVTEVNQYWSVSDVTVKSLPSPNSGFWFNNKQYGHIGYINFTDTDLEELKSSGDSGGSGEGGGGLIYQEALEYIEFNYSSRNDEVFISNLKLAVGARISAYEFEKDFLTNLLVVNSYVYADDNKTIKELNINIPVDFINLQVVNGSGETESVTFEINVVKNFKLISSQTIVDTNIYAIPIYSPFVMKFPNSSVLPTTDTDRWVLSIDTSKVQVGHFGTKNGVTYSYNRANGDYVKFVVINETQFDEFIYPNRKDIANYMSTLLKNESDMMILTQPEISTESNPVNQIITFDLSIMEEGRYFIFAFYYESGSNSHIVRVSDNFVVVDLDVSGTYYSTSTSVETFTTYNFA